MVQGAIPSLTYSETEFGETEVGRNKKVDSNGKQGISFNKPQIWKFIQKQNHECK